MGKTMRGSWLLLLVAGLLWVGLSRADAQQIGTADIVSAGSHTINSGNGVVDLQMLTHGSGGAGNIVHPSPPGFNGDDANTSLPTGGGSSDSLSFAESYVTTAGKLQDFYNLNFGPNSVHDLVLFLDLNETKDGGAVNTLSLLDVILNPATINGNPNPNGTDVASSVQNAIDQTYTGGTKIAYLDPQPADNLPLTNQGAGFADYAILTHIDPYALNASDVLLFNVSMADLSDGPEDIFISGSREFDTVPEPATLALLSFSLLGLAGYRRRRKAG